MAVPARVFPRWKVKTMFFGKKNRGIRLDGRAHLALRVADQALRKYFTSEQAGWLHMNITQNFSSNGDENEYAAFFEGVFFGDDYQMPRKGSVYVRLRRLGDQWISTSVHVNHHGLGEPESVGYITYFEAARVVSHTYDDAIPELRIPCAGA